ncbi:UNVERIFIED_CONTAM: hypothetical protein FKN15_073520 [Acipenser sinensis]
MTELRKRGGGDHDAENISFCTAKDTDGEDRFGLGGEGDRDSKPDTDTPEVQPSVDNTPKCLNKALAGMSSRWKNWWIRGILTLTMISGFFLIIYMGPLPLMLMVLAIQIKCFQEIITIGYRVYHSYELPWFRTLSWFIVPISAVICNDITAYICGFFFGRTPLIKFAWTHVTLLIVVSQSHLVIQNLFEGLIWFIVPISAVICNDITAYICGFFFGRTPLIKLSPKKTWEGFIGGFFSTVMFGFIDFADTIPGHGGIMDRFDCQYLVATFVHVYLTSFIRGPNPSKVLQQLLVLQPEQQLSIFNTLKSHLTETGMIPPAIRGL